jgi:hypothetical protein
MKITPIRAVRETIEYLLISTKKSPAFLQGFLRIFLPVFYTVLTLLFILYT